MVEPSSPLPHHFPDRAIRDALAHPHNLRALLRRALPELAEQLDFEQLEVVSRAFLLDDWRRREADILVRLPLRLGAEGEAALVCVLVEHQSAPDQAMPLRGLLYAVLYWEQEWKAWEAHHERGRPLRLTPVVPVVLHTGPEPWDTNRSMIELFDGPAALSAYVPQWRTLWFDLAAHSPEELLRTADAWWQAMAVVRADRGERAHFAQVFGEAVRGLEPLSGQDKMRWHQLLRLVLYWGLFRRRAGERQGLIEAARSSQRDMALQQEVQAVAQQIEQTWEQELLARGEARGKQEGELQAHRKILQRLLQARFSSLPASVLEKIQATSNLERLQACIEQVSQMQSLDDVQL
jgi:hypothetical protein